MRNRTGFFIKATIGLCIFVFFVFYFFHQSRAFLLGPQLFVGSPKNGETLIGTIVSVNGNASNADVLLLNDRVIIADGSGNFDEKLILAKGYNIIELTAKDKFGREKSKKIEVVSDY
ncbi:MAG: hypothetical protein K9M15_00315 [Candidatus Marinimicrobia bacterium]|nr:hypothetical protein [Candidatus Neomarinimicrobiota bacterium]